MSVETAGGRVETKARPQERAPQERPREGSEGVAIRRQTSETGGQSRPTVHNTGAGGFRVPGYKMWDSLSEIKEGMQQRALGDMHDMAAGLARKGQEKKVDG